MKKLFIGCVISASICTAMTAPSAQANTLPENTSTITATHILDPQINPYALPLSMIIIVALLTASYQSNFSS